MFYDIICLANFYIFHFLLSGAIFVIMPITILIIIQFLTRGHINFISFINSSNIDNNPNHYKEIDNCSNSKSPWHQLSRFWRIFHKEIYDIKNHSYCISSNQYGVNLKVNFIKILISYQIGDINYFKNKVDDKKDTDYKHSTFN